MLISIFEVAWRYTYDAAAKLQMCLENQHII